MRPLGLIVQDETSDIGRQILATLDDEIVGCDFVCGVYAAVSWLDDHVPAFIMLDMQLPSEAGLDLLRYIDNDPRLTNVLVLTTRPEYDTDLSLEDQIDYAVLQPLNLLHFMQFLSQAFGQI